MKQLNGLALLLIIGLVAVSCGAPATKGENPPGGGTEPAKFTTSNLTVAPNTAKPGEKVTVGVVVKNTGGQEGTYTVMVKDHDGSIIGMQDVTLAGGANKHVTIQIALNKPGMHMVMIEDLEGNLEIEGAAANTTAPMPTGHVMPPAQPPPTQPVPPPQQPPMQGMPPAQPPPAPPTAAGFTVSGLGVEPEMPDPSDNITVVFTVKNNGTQAATYRAEVKINGQIVATRDIALAAGETKAVNIPAKAPDKEGTFTVAVGDQTSKMTVMAM